MIYLKTVSEDDILKPPAKKAAAKRASKKAAAKKAPAAKPVPLSTESADSESADQIIASAPSMHMLFMKRGASYITASGASFTRAHPYQLVNTHEYEMLLETMSNRFSPADPEQVQKYYQSGL